MMLDDRQPIEARERSTKLPLPAPPEKIPNGDQLFTVMVVHDALSPADFQTG